ncbi:sorbitol dehydrogenase-like [Dysidea avara]|uniref:sorbitol dehydrogenase-like n=1 Tax=Dysidea avara TaxID=196820 RepID=UPI003317C48E
MEEPVHEKTRTDDDDNVALVLYGVDDLRMVPWEKPSPKPGEVLLRMQSVGICTSDVHFWTWGRIGDYVVTSPMVMGHEASGCVVAVGDGVKNLQVGDRVAVEPGVPCRHCNYCKQGRYNLCPDVKCCSCPPVHGSLTHYYCHDADFCYKLPNNIPYDHAALLEPLSVAVHACQRGGVCLGSKVLICGAGPIGLVCLLTAKACGAAHVIITDLMEQRLEVAMAMGADQVVKVDTKDTQKLANHIRDTMGDAPDVSIECTGVEASITTAIYATRSGGVVALIGLGAPMATVPIVNAVLREVDIRGVFRYHNCYPVAMEMLSSGSVPADKLDHMITHHYKLADSLEAFETAKTGRGGAIKVIIHCD